MKKLILLLAVIVCALCSCADANAPDISISIPVKIMARLENDETVFKAEISEGSSRITFDEKFMADGLELIFSDGKGRATIGKYSREIDPKMFPAQEVFCRAIRIIASENSERSDIENGKKYSLDETVILVYYDTESKSITRIVTEERGRRFDFVIVGIEINESESIGSG